MLFLGADDTACTGYDTLAWWPPSLANLKPGDLVYGDHALSNFRWVSAFDLDRLLFQALICHQAIFYRLVFGTIGQPRFTGSGRLGLQYSLLSQPSARHRYMHVVVASYNEFGGLNNLIVDRSFEAAADAGLGMGWS